MKLLMLPGLAQTCLLQQLPPYEFILLATCSKRSAKAVSWNLRLTKLEIWVGTYQTIGNSLDVPFYLSVGGKRIKILSVRNSLSDAGDRYQEVTVNGETFRFTSIITSPQSGQLLLFCKGSLFAKIPSIHTFLCEIFKAPLKFFLVSETRNWHFLHRDTVSRCDFTELNPSEFRGMDYFFKTQPIKFSILNGSQVTPTDLECYKCFECISNVLIKNADRDANFVILEFEGENLLLEDSEIQLVYLKSLLESWMKKQGGNLKTVIVKLHPTSCIDSTELLRGIKTDKCENGTIYDYDSVIKEYHTFPSGAFDCMNGLNITRKTDGKRATVKVTKDYFMFLVW